MKARKSRMIRIGITYDLFQEFITQGYTTAGCTINCIDGVPENAIFLYAFPDNNTRIIWMYFSHPNFEEVDLGSVIPEFRPKFVKYYPSVESV